MAITKQAGRQKSVIALVDINATDFNTAIVGTAGTSLMTATNLPQNAKIIGGSLTVITPFNTEGVSANAVLTATLIPSTTETVTIGSQVFTFKTTLTASTTANEVLIGASLTTALANLASAINGTAGAGTTYGSLTVPRTDMTALATPTTLTLKAVRGKYATLDTLATTETCANASFGAVTMVDYVVSGDTIVVKKGSEVLSATASIVPGATAWYAVTSLGTEYTSPAASTVDVLWDVADNSTLAPTAGLLRLRVEYVVTTRAQFTQG